MPSFIRLGHYDTPSYAKLALRQWRGLYGDPNVDPSGMFFRVRYMPSHAECPFAVLSFTDRAEADACDEEGEVPWAGRDKES